MQPTLNSSIHASPLGPSRFSRGLTGLAVAVAAAAMAIVGPTSPAHATEGATGSLGCPAGQTVTIVSTGMGHVVHEFTDQEGPDHLVSWKTYNHGGALWSVNQTKTQEQWVHWHVNHLDVDRNGVDVDGSIDDAYAFCEG